MHRIAKVISNAGVCSRRDAEELIHSRQVMVNGVIITSPAIKVKTDDKIYVANKLVPQLEPPRLWKYYKPLGLITTHKDDRGRDTVFASLKDKLPRVIAVGRLDINSEGLLLLTNNGDIARALELPKNNIARVYKVRAFGNPKLINKSKFPVIIDGIKYSPKSITMCTDMKEAKSNYWFNVVLTEGKNREIRKIFTYYGLQVNRLIRTSFGPFTLGKLKSGEFQEQNIQNSQKIFENIV